MGIIQRSIGMKQRKFDYTVGQLGAPANLWGCFTNNILETQWRTPFTLDGIDILAYHLELNATTCDPGNCPYINIIHQNIFDS